MKTTAIHAGDSFICSKGQYAGRVVRVVRFLPEHGTHGFAEVKLALPNGDFKASRDSDLVPAQYLRPETKAGRH